MSQYLIYVRNLKFDEPPPLLPWQNNLCNQGIVVLPVRSLRDAVQTSRVYPVLAARMRGATSAAQADSCG